MGYTRVLDHSQTLRGAQILSCGSMGGTGGRVGQSKVGTEKAGMHPYTEAG